MRVFVRPLIVLISCTNRKTEEISSSDTPDTEVNTMDTCDTSGTDVEYQPSIGTTYSEITGVLSYTFGNYKILPTTASSLVAQ